MILVMKVETLDETRLNTTIDMKMSSNLSKANILWA
jgi:hypothetical protein